MAAADEPGIVDLRHVFTRPDGTRRTRAEALKLVGHRAVWVAEMNQALEIRLAGPPPLSVPPRLFLSYRWGSDDDNAWVAALVDDLRTRGYVVVFDRTDKPAEIDVPRFVARLADCHTFVAVLDPGYEERLGSPEDETGRTLDGWVFDEFNTAAHLANEGRLQVVGLLRRGERLPRGFAFPAPGRPGNAVDVREAVLLRAALDQLFPAVRGTPSGDVLGTVAALIGESHDAIVRGDVAAAIDLATRAVDACPQIMDGHAQSARAAAAAGRSREALAAVQQALDIAPDACDLWMLGAASAYQERDAFLAAKYCVAILERGRDRRVRALVPHAHYYLGNVLDDAGLSHAGLAHLEIARALASGVPNFHNDAGLAYRHVNQLDRALACFDEGLKAAPADTRLLVNRAAALIEAGDAAGGRAALQRLASVQPDHEAVAGLAAVLDRWQADGGDPPALVPRIARHAATGVVSCSRCAAHVPLESDRVLLCAGCGAPRVDVTGRCTMCGHDGLVPVGLAKIGLVHLQCPYCRQGEVRFGEDRTVE